MSATKTESGKTLLEKVMLHSDILTQCMHCGLCLAVCPTYDLTKLERSSPRGRIRLIKELSEGRSEISETFIKEMNFCLDCQACETACPAGVKYGQMVEAARDYITESEADKGIKQAIKSFFLNRILAVAPALSVFSFFMAFYRKSGLQWLVRKTSILKLLPGNLDQVESLSPEFDFFPAKYSEIERAKGEPRHQAMAFHTGCLMKHAFGKINDETVDLLQSNGYDVLIPGAQVCCGSLHAHNGEGKKALELAKRNIDAFSGKEYQYLISNSAGCGAFMKEYGHLLENDPDYREKARVFSRKVKDVTELLAEIDFEKHCTPLSADVTYHDACHLCHTQKITQQPRKVIKRIPGVNYRELEDSTWCCGSAGIYNVMEYDSAMKFLDKKLKNINATSAKIVVTGNPGCIGQIKAGIQREGGDTEVLHPVELIMRSYKKG